MLLHACIYGRHLKTLAVGVNMRTLRTNIQYDSANLTNSCPTIAAHTVIIHGTRHWAGNWEEYSDLDIMQMMGRAVSFLVLVL